MLHNGCLGWSTIGGDARYVVDKRPFNFLHLGLISLLLPNARIINVVREPGALAVSTYFESFRFMWEDRVRPKPPLDYAFNLNAISKMFRQYQILMEHWQTHLQSQILNVAYEDLIDDFAATTKAMYEFVGIEWTESVHSFHVNGEVVDNTNSWHVRQPLYSTARDNWRNYEQLLPELGQMLTSTR